MERLGGGAGRGGSEARWGLWAGREWLPGASSWSQRPLIPDCDGEWLSKAAGGRRPAHTRPHVSGTSSRNRAQGLRVPRRPWRWGCCSGPAPPQQSPLRGCHSVPVPTASQPPSGAARAHSPAWPRGPGQNRRAAAPAQAHMSPSWHHGGDGPGLGRARWGGGPSRALPPRVCDRGQGQSTLGPSFPCCQRGDLDSTG